MPDWRPSIWQIERFDGPVALTSSDFAFAAAASRICTPDAITGIVPLALPSVIAIGFPAPRAFGFGSLPLSVRRHRLREGLALAQHIRPRQCQRAHIGLERRIRPVAVIFGLECIALKAYLGLDVRRRMRLARTLRKGCTGLMTAGNCPLSFLPSTCSIGDRLPATPLSGCSTMKPVRLVLKSAFGVADTSNEHPFRRA